MTDETEYYEDGDDYPETGSPLVKDLRAQLKLKNKAQRELEARLAELEPQVKKAGITEVLKGAGIADIEKATKVALSMGVDPSSMDDWISEYGGLFGAKAPGAGTPAAPPAVTQESYAGQMEAMQGMAATTPPGNPQSPVTEADLKAASSLEELMALIKRG